MTLNACSSSLWDFFEAITLSLSLVKILPNNDQQHLLKSQSHQSVRKYIFNNAKHHGPYRRVENFEFAF